MAPNFLFVSGEHRRRQVPPTPVPAQGAVQHVGGDLRRGHRQPHPGGEEWIDERRGVAEQEVPVPRDPAAAIAVVARGPHGRDAPGDPRPVARRGTAPQRLLEQALRRETAAPQRCALADETDAGRAPGQRDEPEPSVAQQDEHDVAPGGPRSPGDILVVGEDRRLAQTWHHVAQPPARCHEGVAAAGVEQKTRPAANRPAVAPARRDRAAVAMRMGRLDHGVPLVHPCPPVGGVAQQQLVEAGAQDLIGLRVPRNESLGEHDVARDGAVARHQVRAPLLHEALCHAVEDPEAPQEVHVVGQERLTDVEPREDLLLEERDAASRRRQERGGGRAGRSASDHADIRRHLDRRPRRHVASLGSRPTVTHRKQKVGQSQEAGK